MLSSSSRSCSFFASWTDAWVSGTSTENLVFVGVSSSPVSVKADFLRFRVVLVVEAVDFLEATPSDADFAFKVLRGLSAVSLAVEDALLTELRCERGAELLATFEVALRDLPTTFLVSLVVALSDFRVGCDTVAAEREV